MAAPKKQRRVERKPNTSDSDDSADENQNGNDGEMETIDIDLDVKFPEDADRDGIKMLLKQMFLKAHINLSELADLLIEQNTITGVIKEADSDDVDDMDTDMDVNLGVFSIVNLTAKKNMDCVKQIRSLLLSSCKNVCGNDKYELFTKILDDNENHVGFIISERLINIPPKIAVPLYAGLSHDIAKAKEKKESYNFSCYLIICKIIVFDEGSANENVIYLNAEEELIAEVATFSFDFSVSEQQDSGLGGAWTDDDDEGHPKRRVLVFPASEWDSMYHKMTQELGT
ncbi:protein BCCIP homolog [Uloborus diversus]|uniref:protein BCCIP homolog n=1 Tax=Uloborus diversus TaxID=327109 RepID=UPI002409043A|nr:protein BCCIP homolog [Uloborus diversus]